MFIQQVAARSIHVAVLEACFWVLATSRHVQVNYAAKAETTTNTETNRHVQRTWNRDKEREKE